MRIGVDVHIAAKANRRGIPHYVHEVGRRLIQRPEHEWLLLHVGSQDLDLLPPEFREHPNLRAVSRGRMAQLGRLRASGRGHDALLDDPGALFVPGLSSTWPSGRVPTVLTVHDMLHVTDRDHFGWKHRLWWQLTRPESVTQRATLVLADSQHTAAELQHYAGLGEDRVRVVPLGIDDHYFDEPQPGEIESVLERHGLRPGFVLHVGTIESRKNIDTLVRAIRLVREDVPEAECVLAGAPGADAAEQLAEVQPGAGVRVLGIVDEDDKRGLYRAAGVYCSLSHAEGFGLTPLEALACGTPVVASGIEPFEETMGGGVATLVEERTDPAVVATALAHSLRDGRLRAAQQAKARVRLETYTWQRCADSSLEAILDAAR